MSALPRLYFKNPAGCVLEHPDQYVVLEYLPGQRQLTDLQALLTHTGNLLRRTGWYRLLSDQRLMTAFTEAESKWIIEYWLDSSRQRTGGLYGAVMLAENAYAYLPNDQRLTEATAAALTYRFFDREEPAAAWLLTV